MASDKTKSVKCTKCGFVFETPKTMVERPGCYTTSYCDKLDKNTSCQKPNNMP